jgi:tRNA(fMet)-specific endonuclease VapC
MIYFLDTNICVFYLKGINKNVCEKLEAQPTTNIKIPSMVAAELLFGAEKSAKREHNLKIFEYFLSIYEIINFDMKAAVEYAVIRAELERKGNVIGSNDIVIAAITLANDGLLVTNNTNEFLRINALKIIDWTCDE